MTEHIHRLDPIKFPDEHSLLNAPFFTKVKGMPHFNALFAWVWFHGFTKIVNMVQHLSPASGESFDSLFTHKLPKVDGSPSDVFVINANLMALLHYYVDCSIDASAPFRRSRRVNFERHLALYVAYEQHGIDWRGELMELLKHWSPDFDGLFKKKRVMKDSDLSAYSLAQQVDPLLL